MDYKDAVFLGPHKFVGGPGSPGVLAVHRDLLHNPVPAVPGGGTVRVRRPAWGHHLLDDVEHREEGGTPDIIGSIRAGLALGLKEAIGLDVITALGQPPPADRRRSAAAVGPMSGRHCGAGAPRNRVTSAASAARARRTPGSTSSNPVPCPPHRVPENHHAPRADRQRRTCSPPRPGTPSRISRSGTTGCGAAAGARAAKGPAAEGKRALKGQWVHEGRAQAGGGVVEAYLQDTAGKQITASFLYRGTRSLFEQAVFTHSVPRARTTA